MATKKKMLQAAAGNATGGGAGSAALNVEDVFSTYLYEGNGGSQVIQNGINLGQSFGSGSVEFSDGSSDWIVSQSSSEFAFGTGDFTLECWVYRTSDTGSTNNLIDLRESDNTENKPSLAIDSSDKVAYYSNGSWRTVGTTSVPIGQWVHLAVVRSSGTTKVYYNGTAEGTAFSDSYNYSASTVANIGGAWSGDFDLDGYIAEARISDTARYTANFTTPTAPFSSDANTVLLTCKGADPFVDNSPNAFTITQNGTPEATTFGPFDAAEAGEGGMVWQKRRDVAENHRIFDTETGEGKYLITNSTAAQGTDAGNGTFNSNGFSISGNNWNTNGADYASWTFRKAPKFFTCLTYTGTGSAQNISHDLGSAPGMVIVKRTDANYNWECWHSGLTDMTKYIRLNTTEAERDEDDFNLNLWNQTAPTDTSFTVGTWSGVNASGGTYVAYLFAHNDGDGEFGPDGDADIIKCGSYTGTSAAGNFIDLGFEPQWVLYKRTDTTGNWVLQDNMRGMDHTSYDLLYANTSGAEVSGTAAAGAKADPRGFTVDLTGGDHNVSGGTYIYIAIRRGTKVPESATEVFALSEDTANGSYINTGFTVDMSIWNNKSGYSGNSVVNDRIRGVSSNSTYSGPELQTSSANAEGAISQPTLGWDNTGLYATTGSTMYWLWKRAPGFFDLVAYSGDGVAGRTVSHNLGVAPEMMWVKARGGSENWPVYHASLGNSQELRLDTNNTPVGGAWNSTDPTSSEFTLASYGSVNNSSLDYVAYLFASLDGVSKVGSFSHTSGTPTNVDCGFTSGARFVLWKKYSGTDGWQVYDTTRGIVAGDDPFLQLNVPDNEITNEDLIDPLSSGFTVAAGKNSGDYIFYAIA